MSVGPSVHPITFLNSEWFLHYCSCPTVRDCIAMYPALIFLVAETQLCKRLCLSVGPSLSMSRKVGKILSFFLYVPVLVGRRVWTGVGCPCPPVRNNIVTPHHLLYIVWFMQTKLLNKKMDLIEFVFV